MKIFVSNEEILHQKGGGFLGINGNAELLVILKNRGAPINGTIVLKADTKNYNWRHYKDVNGHYIQWLER